MTMQEKARQAAVRAVKDHVWRGDVPVTVLPEAADAVAAEVLREVLALEMMDDHIPVSQVRPMLAEFSPSPRPEPAAPPRDVDPETALGDCPACGLPMPHGPAGCPRTLRKWMAEPAAPETPEPPRCLCGDSRCAGTVDGCRMVSASESRPTTAPAPSDVEQGKAVYCGERKGGFACTRAPGHAEDHIASDRLEGGALFLAPIYMRWKPAALVSRPSDAPPVQAPEGRTLKEKE